LAGHRVVALVFVRHSLNHSRGGIRFNEAGRNGYDANSFGTDFVREGIAVGANLRSSKWLRRRSFTSVAPRGLLKGHDRHGIRRKSTGRFDGGEKTRVVGRARMP
jgi:hypothetical protein